MAATSAPAALLAAALALAACSDTSGMYTGGATPPGGVSQVPLTPMGTVPVAYSQPGAAAPAAVSGTYVGRKAADLRGEHNRLLQQIQERQATLQQVRGSSQANSQAYYTTVAGISARLQTGTTPGNPILTEQWNQAQLQLDKVNEDVAQLNRLANMIASDASFAAYILDATRAAYGLSGAVDEDHRQLQALEDDVNRTVVVIQRLLQDVSEDVTRQQAYVANERRNLNTLSVAVKNGELYSAAQGARPMQSTSGLISGAPQQAVAASPLAFGGGSQFTGTQPGAALSGRSRPLVTIRFDRPNVSYQQALYSAVSQALDRRPDARFDVVAVSPGRGNAGQLALSNSGARRQAEQVMRSLTEMGLQGSRVDLSAASSPDITSNEVQVFVR